ncbi:MAG: hypothetical protein J6J42_10895 [Lachnospiraceae bacterium]|nr:hypothetical protein [Lachnospiraceae bacterium]MBP3610826.1 hypothetical protein [Lachnospiraceae bacterium]
MLRMHSTQTLVEGTSYTVEYTITKNASDYELEEICEYGISCSLYGENQEIVSSEEIKCITPNFARINEMVHILKRNQVFPVHLKEIVCELLEQDNGTDGEFAFCA